MTPEEKKHFRRLMHDAVPVFENAVEYALDEGVHLYHLSYAMESTPSAENREKFASFLHQMHKIPCPHRKITLWQNGNMPVCTDYAANQDFKYNHDPDYQPYMWEYLLEENIKPKGAVLITAGGDHGRCTLTEGWQTARDFHDLGYQCFVLLNRPHHNPWSKQEAGADASRALRIIRRNAEAYRIKKNQIALVGFSNGGITGDSCIAYYSGKKTIRQSFKDYVPDELDEEYGCCDCFLNIYGPRFARDPFEPGYVFNYEGVAYPPTFIAVGRADNAMENLAAYVPSLLEHNIPVEVHTFAGTPHGIAGMKIVEDEEKWKTFDLWLPLADAFMQNVYETAKRSD